MNSAALFYTSVEYCVYVSVNLRMFAFEMITHDLKIYFLVFSVNKQRKSGASLLLLCDCVLCLCLY